MKTLIRLLFLIRAYAVCPDLYVQILMVITVPKHVYCYYSHGKQFPGPDDKLEDVLQWFHRLTERRLVLCVLIGVVYILLQNGHQFTEMCPKSTVKSQKLWTSEKLTATVWAMSWENLLLPYANYKAADQTAHPCSLISAFVVSCLDNIIPLLAITEISRL